MFAFFASGKCTRTYRIISRLIADQSSLLKHIDFVLLERPNNSDLVNLLSKSRIAFIEYSPDTKFSPSTEKTQRSDFILKSLKTHGTTYLFFFGTQILVGSLLEQMNGRIFNFHPSILPAYPGMHAIDKARVDNAFLFGNTIHLIIDKLDGGPIVMQSIIHASFASDYDDILDQQIPMAIQLMAWIKEDRFVVENGAAKILKADYSAGTFIPKLEIDHSLRMKEKPLRIKSKY